MADTHSREDALVRMLCDILSEAEAIRWCDPAKAQHLDEAANDLRAVIAEADAPPTAQSNDSSH